MTQLRSCYFCGAVGDSLQEYEVVPERLVSPGESRSAVLCSTCHEKLRRVLEPIAETGETTSSPDRSVDSLEEVTFGATEQSDGDPGGDPDASEEATEDTDDETTDDPETADGSPSERAADSESAPADDDEASAETEDVPDGYYKVIRLLQNREFPMERDALTGMVTSAYDVTEPQCERILQTAIDRGVLVEDGATIDIGRN